MNLVQTSAGPVIRSTLGAAMQQVHALFARGGELNYENDFGQEVSRLRQATMEARAPQKEQTQTQGHAMG